DAMRLDGYQAIMIEARNEALRVVTAMGYKTLPIFGLDEEDVQNPETVVETMTDRLFSGFVRPGATTTVLQDWQRGRHSEVDDLNGLVVRSAKRLGLDVPVNRRVVGLAHRIERGEVRPDPSLL